LRRKAERVEKKSGERCCRDAVPNKIYALKNTHIHPQVNKKGLVWVLPVSKER
jgi:hypothetical protein